MILYYLIIILNKHTLSQRITINSKYQIPKVSQTLAYNAVCPYKYDFNHFIISYKKVINTYNVCQKEAIFKKV